MRIDNTTTEWSVFVQTSGEASRRGVADPSAAAPIDMGTSEWVCSYSATSRAQVDANNWSEVRTLECRHGELLVSTSGFCQISRRSWASRAATLSLGQAGLSGRTQITVDCAVR